ncbi:MAG: PQQ-like beta-propeller repeat protein, partial [Planctomycetes bacterium]|nr:PQQ-like beta-propeller repeat protein [Planctomycetota bacterium]
STEVLGLDANTGKLLWRKDHASKLKHNWSTPVWGNDNLLFVSSAAPAGSRVFRLTLKDSETKVDELWHNPKAGIQHANAIRVDDYIYGCFTEESSDYFAAVNVKTGKFAWKESGFPQANFAYANGKTFLLDKDGTLSLATVSPEKLTLHASARVLEKALGAVPILAGTTLYIRNGQGIFAYDVSPNTLVDDSYSGRPPSPPPAGGATNPKEK